ncbi:lipopolysaccharide biosynthesis protein [Actinopolymorpha pittospori]|uniref:O-antigen/teichoic acid export membrane protein n=1 Tax=Actinopolymorpha pittospori TaxID=648752 RepID=A0A927RQ46_9ACTN|nr:lipopolysaccharide biosynthesis protein [Actinopolymorpha pittospori]MBE1612766.1 O-antigen/teichoic acid export membrane protein [Actinopolymorpha pittospori]
MSHVRRTASRAAGTTRAERPARAGARRGVVEIVLGTVLGQGLLAIASPLLSRLYTPADFALLQIFTGVVSMGAVLASLRLELAIPLARDVRETRAVLRAGLFGTVVVAVLVWLLGLATAGLWAVGTTLVDLRSSWWLVPLTVAAIAVFQLVSAVLVRAERYRDIAGRNAVQGVGTAAAQIGLGLAGTRPLGLLLGMSIGRAAGLVSIARNGLFPRAAGEPRTRVTAGEMVAAVSHFRRFPLLTTWAALLNNAGQYAPYLVFTLTYGQNPTGYLAFTTRLLAVPVTVVGQAVAQVFLGRGASAQRGATGELPRLTWLAVRRLALLGLAPAVLLSVIGPWVFGWVFGGQWERAGQYAQVLAVAFLAQFVASPISNVFNLVERQGLALVWEVVRLALVIGAPWLVFALGGSDLAGVAAYAGVLVFSYGGVLALVWWVLRRA